MITTMQTLDEQIAFIEANGWKECQTNQIDSHDRHWFKRFPGEPRCATNSPKPLQLQLRLWDMRQYGESWWSFDLVLHAEPESEAGWVQFVSHAFGPIDAIGYQVNRLLKAWRAIHPDTERQP